jgi:cell division protein ZapA
MAQVNVRINGKTYRMACDDGEENHLASLAERLNRSIEQLRDRFGEIGDQRLTVMAAITLADQQAEAERRLHELESKIAGIEAAHADRVTRNAAAQAEVARVLGALAEKVEGLADRVAGVGGRPNGG